MKTWRLVSGIISICMCLFVLLQSCAAGFVNAVENNGQSSGTAGMIVSLLMLAAGILSIATRNEFERSSSTALAVLYGLAALIGVVFAGNFTDLILWALWCFVCAVLAVGGYALARVDEMPDDENPTAGELHGEGAKPKKRRPVLTALKWVLIGCVGLFVLLVVVAMFTHEDVPLETPDLTGRWKQVNAATDDSYQTAIITDSTIEVYWINKSSQTQSLYWSGTFKAPTTPDQPYSWVSQNDKSKTDYALLASPDDTKTFTYEKGKISYSVSMLGITKTVNLEKVS